MTACDSVAEKEAMRRGAAAAGEWALVQKLTDELAALRKAAAGIVDLEAERAKRGGS